MLRWGWIAWAALLVVAALLLSSLTALQLAIAAPLGAFLLLWPLWRGGRWLLHRLLSEPQRAWHGRYYEHDGRQIRVLTDEHGQLWVCAADVFDALQLRGGQRDPDRARIKAGREGLRQEPSSGLLCFTERGLISWLERRTDRLSVAFARWLQAQVIAPHHRRRQLRETAPAQDKAGPAEPK